MTIKAGYGFHRPCFFPEIITDEKGKERKKYKYENMKTPFEKLKSLPDWTQYLKEGTPPLVLESKAESMSDNEAARKLLDARESLFQHIFERKA